MLVEYIYSLCFFIWECYIKMMVVVNFEWYGEIEEIVRVGINLRRR